MRLKIKNRVRKVLIETERLVVTGWDNNDEFLGYTLFGDPTISSYYSMYGFRQDEIDDIVKGERNRFEKNKIGILPIFEKVEGKQPLFIGIAGIREFKENYQLAIILMPNKWKQGYGQEIGQTIIDYAFDKLNIPYLIAARSDDDKCSEYIYEKLGFKEIRNIFRTPNEKTYHTYILEKEPVE